MVFIYTINSSNNTYYDEEITEIQVAANNQSAEIEMDGYTFTVDSNLNITHIDGSLAVTIPSSGSSGSNSETNQTPALGTTIPGAASGINVTLVATNEIELSQLYGKKVISEGSMYVWIPRYAYKFESGYHLDETGEITIKFLNTNNTYKDGSDTTTLLVNPLEAPLSSKNCYVVHPAFKWSKENGTPLELEGIWIAKFEASATDATFENHKNGQLDIFNDIITPTNSVILRSVGNVSSWRSLTLNKKFTNCYNMNKDSNIATVYGISTDKNIIDPHLMKNIEWGAVAYLAHSKYGRNKIEDETMNNLSGYTTGNGNYKQNIALSTTNNIYGIYDMAGGSWESVAAYVDSTRNGTIANTYLTKENYGKDLYEAEEKYKDVYEVALSDDSIRNYCINIHKFGDAVFETSYGTSDYASAWNDDRTTYPYSAYPFFLRGCDCTNTSHTGIFSFYLDNGSNTTSTYSFRPSITVL